MKAIALFIQLNISEDSFITTVEGEILAMPPSYKPSLEQLNELQEACNKSIKKAKEILTNGPQQVPYNPNN